MSENPLPKPAGQENDSASAPDIDLEKAPLEKVLATLGVDPDQGLGCAEAAKRRDQHGPNAIVEKEQGLLSKLLGHFTGPIAYMIEAAAIVSAVLGRWDDFAVIFGLLIFIAALEFWQDRKASSALAALKGSLAPGASVKRDGNWATVKAADLVPGDVVTIRLGVIVPADLRLTKGERVSIDQAALTGESLPVEKRLAIRPTRAAWSSRVIWKAWSSPPEETPSSDAPPSW